MGVLCGMRKRHKSFKTFKCYPLEDSPRCAVDWETTI